MVMVILWAKNMVCVIDVNYGVCVCVCVAQREGNAGDLSHPHAPQQTNLRSFFME